MPSLARSQIEALEKQAKDAESRRAALEGEPHRPCCPQRGLSGGDRSHPAAKVDSTGLIAEKEAEIRAATEKRLLCQKSETEALAKGRVASDEREEMGREMARLAERKAAAESEYDQMAAKLWDEYQLTLSQAEALCVEFENVNALRHRWPTCAERSAHWAASTSAPSRNIRRSKPATMPSGHRWRTLRAAKTS